MAVVVALQLLMLLPPLALQLPMRLHSLLLLSWCLVLDLVLALRRALSVVAWCQLMFSKICALAAGGPSLCLHSLAQCSAPCGRLSLLGRVVVVAGGDSEPRPKILTRPWLQLDKSPDSSGTSFCNGVMAGCPHSSSSRMHRTVSRMGSPIRCVLAWRAWAPTNMHMRGSWACCEHVG